MAITISDENYVLAEIDSKYVEKLTFNSEGSGSTKIRFKPSYESDTECYKTAWLLQSECDKKNVIDVDCEVNDKEETVRTLIIPKEFEVDAGV